MGEELLHVLEHAFIDSIKIFPFLLIAYIIIELIEYYASNKMQKTLSGKSAPLFGALFGLVPQCGFSVVAADMYSKRMITMGTLMAVFIATSDEAIPLMLANPDSARMLLPLLLIKLVFALLVGYLIDFALKSKIQKPINNVSEEHHTGCCHHEIESKRNKWVELLVHPLLHSLKILAYIFIFNLIFGLIIMWVTEDALINFLQSSSIFAPFIAGSIGLIPNCASSVILTELFIMNGIDFGALVAGLCVNAGLGMVFLFKNNKNLKENLFIISMLYVLSVALGYVIMLF